MAIRNESYVTILISELERDADRGSMLAKYGKEWQLSTRTFDRYWEVAKERHLKAQQDIQSKLAAQSTQAALQRQESAILTKHERMEIASKIARGETEGDKLRALDYLSRIDGDYAPIKKELQIDSTVDFIINVE